MDLFTKRQAVATGTNHAFEHREDVNKKIAKREVELDGFQGGFLTITSKLKTKKQSTNYGILTKALKPERTNRKKVLFQWL
jgi:hypothetical protein